MRGERKRIALRPDAIPEGMPLAGRIAQFTANGRVRMGDQRRLPPTGGRCAGWEGAEGCLRAFGRVVAGLTGHSRANGRVCTCLGDSRARIRVLPFAQMHVREHVRHMLARMGDLRASPRTVIGAARSPDPQGLCLRPRETLPNARFRPGRASRSHDPVPTARAPRPVSSRSRESIPPARLVPLARTGGTRRPPPAQRCCRETGVRQMMCYLRQSLGPQRASWSGFAPEGGRDERGYSSPPLGALSASP